MKKYIYAVYDSKVKYYHDPILLRNRGEALRSWEKAANDENLEISRHPNDFALMELGEYDDQTGTFSQHPVPESLGLAVQFKNLPQNQPNLFSVQQESKGT